MEKTFFVVKDRQFDTYAAKTLDEAIELLQPDGPLDILSAFSCKADDAGLARLFFAQRDRQTVSTEVLLAAVQNHFKRISE